MDDTPTVKWCSWLWWPANREWRPRLEDVDLGAVKAQAARDRQRFGEWRVHVTSGAVPAWSPRRKTMLQRPKVDALPNGHTAVPAAMPGKRVKVAR